MPEEFDYMRSSLFWWNCAYLSLSLSTSPWRPWIPSSGRSPFIEPGKKRTVSQYGRNSCQGNRGQQRTSSSRRRCSPPRRVSGARAKSSRLSCRSRTTPMLSSRP